MTQLRYEKLHSEFGASVRGVDLGQPLTPAVVQEIDAASYNGVDEVRRLQEGLNFRPARDRFKIYIVDEVHMLSNAAWNAFLKTLEEPPPHVKFIFATTEVHKVPVTILSRCQRYDFKLIATQTIAARLREVLALEKVQAEDGAALPLRPGMELEYWLEAADACDCPKPNVAESKRYKVLIAEPEKDQQKQRQQQQQAQQEQQHHEAKQDQDLKKENQARQEANQRLRQAEALRYRLEQEAEEYRDTQLRQARADAAEFAADLAAYHELRKTVSREEALAFVWWKEVAKARDLLRARGSRVEPLDAHLGPDGLDIQQLLTPKRR